MLAYKAFYCKRFIECVRTVIENRKIQFWVSDFCSITVLVVYFYDDLLRKHWMTIIWWVIWPADIRRELQNAIKVDLNSEMSFSTLFMMVAAAWAWISAYLLLCFVQTSTRQKNIYPSSAIYFINFLYHFAEWTLVM